MIVVQLEGDKEDKLEENLRIMHEARVVDTRKVVDSCLRSNLEKKVWEYKMEEAIQRGNAFYKREWAKVERIAKSYKKNRKIVTMKDRGTLRAGVRHEPIYIG